MDGNPVYSYIPNSAPGIKEEMLREIGVSNVEEILDEIPEEIRFRGRTMIPKRPTSELIVARRVSMTLARNVPTTQLLSFLGAGCWSHYVPALCTEIISRSEFLTAYTGSEATDHGKYQAAFEFQSMIGDLFEMDVVGTTGYDGSSASGDAALMASRITGRDEFLVPRTMNPDTLRTVELYSQPWMKVRRVDSRESTGEMSLDDLRGKLSGRTAAVYVENPTYLGFMESQCATITRLAHDAGALLIACVSPVSLGLLSPPGEFGADIACAEGQPLGLPLSFGGASLGLLACRGEERLTMAMPTFLVGLTNTVVEGERAFSRHALSERLMFSAREKSKSFTGTSSWLWAISVAVYLALLGPSGLRQLGEVNMANAHDAMEALSTIPGIRVPLFSSPHFNEFAVNFDRTGRTVRQVNQALLEQGILGGKDLSGEFPELGETALYCVTEVHTRQDIQRLAEALGTIVQ